MRFCKRPYCSFLWNKCFERSPYLTLPPRYHCSANTKVLKWSYRIIYLINFRNLFHGYLFTLFVLRLFLTLLYKWIEKLEKLKTFLKTCFLHNRIFINSLVIFYGIRKTPTRKIPIQKVPTNQTPPRRIPSPKIPTQKIPT